MTREEQARIIEREQIQRNVEKGVADIKEGRYTVIESSDDLENFFAAKKAGRQKWIDEQIVAVASISREIRERHIAGLSREDILHELSEKDRDEN